MKVLPSHIAENAATRAASTRASGTRQGRLQGRRSETAEITLTQGRGDAGGRGSRVRRDHQGRTRRHVHQHERQRPPRADVPVAHRDGKEYHIYGTGKDRLVVGFHMPSSDKTSTTTPTDTTDKADKTDTSDLKLRKNEKIEPVEGHAYAEITSGAREGMYINTSGNKRHGDAFVLVNKVGVEYHIYGTGADREVIAIKPRRRQGRRVVLTARRSAPPEAPAGSRRRPIIALHHQLRRPRPERDAPRAVAGDQVQAFARSLPGAGARRRPAAARRRARARSRRARAPG